jgi:membrane-associated phospholipid phosphatase
MVEARLAECAERGMTPGSGGCSAYAVDRVTGDGTVEPGICTTAIGVGPDGMYVGQANMSFISGHSGFTCVSMVFTALWFAGKTRAFCSGRERAVWKYLFVLLCWLTALYVSASRVADKRHQWYNALFGTLIGLVTSLVSYHYYFPPVWAPLSHSPLAMKEEAGELAKDSTWMSGRLLLCLQTNFRPSRMPKAA